MQNRIKELREKRGISQEELANEVNLSNQVISFYENGKREPKIEKWQKLADYFNVSVPYLQGYVDEYIEINDLNDKEQDAYERITDMLSQEYTQTRPEFNWSKIGQLLINSDITRGIENGKSCLSRRIMRKNCFSKRDGYAFWSLLHRVY